MYQRYDIPGSIVLLVGNTLYYRCVLLYRTLHKIVLYRILYTSTYVDQIPGRRPCLMLPLGHGSRFTQHKEVVNRVVVLKATLASS